MLDDAAAERRVTIAWKDGCPTLVHRLSVTGVLPAEYKSWTDNYLKNVQALAPPNVTYTDLGEDQGRQCILQRIDPQVMFISARSIVTTAYKKTEDDDIMFFLSSKGNEALAEQQKDRIGSDVVGTLHVNFFTFKPKMDSCGDVIGTDCIQVYSMNPNGSLPSMVVDKLVKKQ